MNRHRSWRSSVVATLVACLGVSSLAAEPLATSEQPTSTPAAPRVTAEVARERAKLMQSVYVTTLHVMHDRYFHDDRAMAPARAMEDVFAELAEQTKIKARWISVNTKPMSVHHEPKTDFEKKAAADIAAGKAVYEQIDDDLYQRAVPIALGSGCVSCHTGFFSGTAKTNRFAALVIGIPLAKK